MINELTTPMTSERQIQQERYSSIHKGISRYIFIRVYLCYDANLVKRKPSYKTREMIMLMMGIVGIGMDRDRPQNIHLDLPVMDRWVTSTRTFRCWFWNYGSIPLWKRLYRNTTGETQSNYVIFGCVKCGVLKCTVGCRHIQDVISPQITFMC